MSIIEVESVEEAVRVAKGLRNSGHRYWFRGQPKNLPVRSTLSRLKPEDREIAKEKARRFGVYSCCAVFNRDCDFVAANEIK